MASLELLVERANSAEKGGERREMKKRDMSQQHQSIDEEADRQARRQTAKREKKTLEDRSAGVCVCVVRFMCVNV